MLLVSVIYLNETVERNVEFNSNQNADILQIHSSSLMTYKNSGIKYCQSVPSNLYESSSSFCLVESTMKTVVTVNWKT